MDLETLYSENDNLFTSNKDNTNKNNNNKIINKNNFTTNTKTKIFNLIHLTLKYQKLNSTYLFVVYLIEFLQILSYSFDIKV